MQILVLARDARRWLQRLALFSEILQQHFESLHYIFLEDSSSDDSPRIIDQFLKESLGERIEPISLDNKRPMPRTTKLGWLRNQLLRRAQRTPSQWTLFIDTDVYFSNQTVEALLDAARQYPKSFHTAFTLGCRVLLPTKRGIWIKSRSIAENHYFDTFALELVDQARTFPSCPFMGCTKCRLGLSDPGQDVMPVLSAFGGMALIDTPTLHASGVNWSENTAPEDCEHRVFCRNLQKSGIQSYVVPRAVAWCDR